MLRFLPLPPRPPLPGEALFEVKEEDEGDGSLDRAFKNRLKTEGFDPELVEMGIKVANNHSRSREDALKIGENYIKEMAK